MMKIHLPNNTFKREDTAVCSILCQCVTSMEVRARLITANHLCVSQTGAIISTPSMAYAASIFMAYSNCRCRNALKWSLLQGATTEREAGDAAE
jgi:hypothetical protein